MEIWHPPVSLMWFKNVRSANRDKETLPLLPSFGIFPALLLVLVVATVRLGELLAGGAGWVGPEPRGRLLGWLALLDMLLG